MPRLRKRNAVDDDVDDADARVVVDAPPPPPPAPVVAAAADNDDGERAKIQSKKTAKGKKKLDTKATPAKITSRPATNVAAARNSNDDAGDAGDDDNNAPTDDAPVTVDADSQKNGRLAGDGDEAAGSLRDAEATNAALDPRFRDESPQRSPTKPALVTDDDERFVAAKAALAALDERAALEAANGSKTRLIITEMNLENFKSYAGKQKIGPFHKRFTAVVGPNGSGKSNVIDALLFIFGRRSQQLRSKKVSELIHRSDAYPDLDYACVSVTFVEIEDDEADADRCTLVPNSEIVVKRVVRSSNESKYYINDRACAFKDVQALLLTKGIDLDNNRFLILQGEVEQISLMKPKGQAEGEEGLLEYLEGIIGTSKYVEPIGVLFGAVEAATEQRNGMVHRVTHVEKELAQLDGSKQEACQYLCHHAEIRAAQATLASINEAEADLKSVEAKQAFDAAEAKASAQAQQIAELEQKRDAFAATFAAEESEFKNKSASLEQTAKDYEGFLQQEAKIHETIKQCAAKRKKLAAAVAKDDKLAITKAHEAEQMKADAEKRKERIESTSTQLVAEEKRLEELVTKETKALNKELATARTALEELLPSLATRRDEQRLCQQQHRLLDQKLTGAQRRLDDAKASLAALQQRRGELDQDIVDRQAELAQNEARLPAIQDELAQLEQSLATQSQLVSEKRAALADVGARAQAASTKSKVWQGLCKAKQQGLLPGIVGRLGDLAGIDAKYDVAASTAAPALNNIVVDTTDTAQKCIKLLRKYDLGVATFIVLERMDEQQRKAAMPCEGLPPGAQRLFDLVVDVQPEHRGALYFALRDTLVANDLSTAQSWAFAQSKRWRVVTLKGELIEASGAMSGGGSHVARGLIGTRKLVDPCAMAGVGSGDASNDADGAAALAASLASAEQSLAAMRAQLQKLEVEQRDVEQSMRQLQRQMPLLEADRRALPTQIAELERELPALAAQVPSTSAADAKQLASLAKQLEQLTTSLNEQQAIVTEREQHVASLERRIVAIAVGSGNNDNSNAGTSKKSGKATNKTAVDDEGNVLVAVQRSKVLELQAALDELRAGVVASEVGAKSAATAAAKAQARLTAAQEELTAAEKEAEQAAAQFDELKVKATEVKQRHKALQHELAALADGLRSAREQHAARDAAIAAARSAAVDVQSALAEAVSIKRDADKRAAQWRSEVATLQRAHAAAMADVPELVRDDVVAATRRGCQHGRRSDDDNELVRAKRSRATTNNDDQDDDVDDDADGAVVDDAATTATTTTAATADGTSAVQASDVANAAEHALPLLSRDRLLKLRKKDIVRQLASLDEALSKLKPNMSAIAKWRAKQDELAARQVELQAVTERRDAARRDYDALRKRRLDEFTAGFAVITMRLKEMYQMITLGGDAELELVDTLDPFSEGVVFSVRPPKKSWKNICNLSGGEKTLSSLALVFALHHYKPTPLYVMDEIDAALDFKNVSIVANYIKERTKNAQFVIISLRNYMFELANRLVGIYKTRDCTKSVMIDPAKFALPTALAPHVATTVVTAPTRSSAPSTTTTTTTTRNATTKNDDDDDVDDKQQASKALASSSNENASNVGAR